MYGILVNVFSKYILLCIQTCDIFLSLFRTTIYCFNINHIADIPLRQTEQICSFHSVDFTSCTAIKAHCSINIWHSSYMLRPTVPIFREINRKISYIVKVLSFYCGAVIGMAVKNQSSTRNLYKIKFFFYVIGQYIHRNINLSNIVFVTRGLSVFYCAS